MYKEDPKPRIPSHVITLSNWGVLGVFPTTHTVTKGKKSASTSYLGVPCGILRVFIFTLKLQHIPPDELRIPPPIWIPCRDKYVSNSFASHWSTLKLKDLSQGAYLFLLGLGQTQGQIQEFQWRVGNTFPEEKTAESEHPHSQVLCLCKNKRGCTFVSDK